MGRHYYDDVKTSYRGKTPTAQQRKYDFALNVTRIAGRQACDFDDLSLI